MGIVEYFNNGPFRQLVGVEITEAEDGYAEALLPLCQEHSSNNRKVIAQGGATFTLLDSVGGAAAVSLVDRPTPTIDFHIDYLNPATSDLYATGEVVRSGAESALISVEARDDSDTPIATGRGLYKTSNLPDDAPWEIDQ